MILNDVSEPTEVRRKGETFTVLETLTDVELENTKVFKKGDESLMDTKVFGINRLINVYLYVYN